MPILSKHAPAADAAEPALPTSSRPATSPPNDVGIRLIVLYKCCKAVVQVALAATLVILAAKGEIEAVRDLATTLIEEGASRWLVLLGKALDVLVSERGVRLLEIGLALDAVISSFEGWALWRGYRWAAWLVVAATAFPLPFEVVLVLRSPRTWRIATILVNLAIVAYLARRVARRHRAGPPALRDPRRASNAQTR